MRPQRFQDLALNLATHSPAAGNVSTLADAGDSKHPFGLAATVEGRPARFQFIAESAPGDHYDQPETPVEAEAVEPLESLTTGAEGWLAGLLAESGNREIAAIEQWSQRTDENERLREGLTVRFHSGAKIYARAL